MASYPEWDVRHNLVSDEDHRRKVMHKYTVPLCATCCSTPWGPTGWRQFHKLCRTSDATAFGLYKSSRYIVYKVSISELLERYEHCVWCCMLVDKFEYRLQIKSLSEEQLSVSHKIEIVFHYVAGTTDDVLDRLNVKWHCHGPKCTILHDSFGVFAKRGSVADKFFLAPTTITHHDLYFDPNLVKKWMTKTDSNTYKPSREDFVLPKRLLYISHEQGVDRVKLRTSTTDQKGQYAILSYAWGPSKDLSDRYVDLARRAAGEGVSLEELPATIRDAILITKNAGIVALWVDGLCIQQQNLTDKLEQLPRMHEYYKNAVLAIQGSGISDVDTNLLSRAARFSWAARVLDEKDAIVLAAMDKQAIRRLMFGKSDDSELKTDGLFTIPFIDQEGLKSVFYISPGSRGPTYSEPWQPTSARGWILQEGLLARRLLIFPFPSGMIFRYQDEGEDPQDVSDGNISLSGSVKSLLPPRGRLMSPFSMQEQGQGILMPAVMEDIRRMLDDWSAGNTSQSVRIMKGVSELYTAPDQTAFEGELCDNLSENDFLITPLVDPLTQAPSRYEVRYVTSQGIRSLRIQTPPGFVTGDEVHRKWLDIAEDYSGRSLADPNDKIAAIAAVARDFSTRYAECLGRYCCGYWEKFLVEGLLWQNYWRLDSNQEELHMSRLAGIPSWSWTSSQAPTYFDLTGKGAESASVRLLAWPKPTHTMWTKVVDFKVQPQQGLEFETVPSILLVKLRGPAIKCSWSIRSAKRWWMTPEVTITPRISFADSVTIRWDSAVIVPAQPEKVILLVLRSEYRGDSISRWNQCQGLVLRDVEMAEGCTRVGHFRLSSEFTMDERRWLEQGFADMTITLGLR